MRTFTVPLPEGVPEPKFQYWQRVKFKHNDAPMTITGIQWTDVSMALATRVDAGWHYCVTSLFGVKTLEELDAVMSTSWEETTIHEDSLEAL